MVIHVGLGPGRTSIHFRFAPKATGSVDKVGKLILTFRNDTLPKIAVTVDLLTTGIDVPKITNLVFVGSVNSRILYDQMIGTLPNR